MARLDLDDLPPRIARELAAMAQGEELLIVQGGAVIGRFTAAAPPDAAPEEARAAEGEMAEILDHFRAMIEEEF